MSGFKDPIRVEGLREVQAALKHLDGQSQKALRVALNNAVEVVAQDARRRMPYRTGKARSTVKASSSQREARVSEGSRRVPYVAWLDYGGRVGRNRSVVRPFRPGGRVLYPAYGAHRDDVLDLLTQEIIEVARQAGLEARV